MENKDVFEFILYTGEKFPISSQSSRLNDICPDIYQKLTSEKQYLIQSNVTKNTFLLFLNYLIKGKSPVITVINRAELFILSQEFQIMGNVFNQNKIEYLNTINALLDTKTQNKQAIIEFISMNLDEFLANIGDEIFNLPIELLYNIFNNEKRQLTRHNNCYDLIK